MLHTIRKRIIGIFGVTFGNVQFAQCAGTLGNFRIVKESLVYVFGVIHAELICFIWLSRCFLTWRNCLTLLACLKYYSCIASVE